jgi:uncharacterized delta-60 repeat protein
MTRQALFLFLLTLFPLASWAAAGDPDATFGGGDGIVQTPIGTSSGAFNLKILEDGRILVVGEGDDGTDLDFAVLRYLPDGSLDESFGASGITLTPIVSGQDSFAGFLDHQNDGSLIVAGESGFNDFVVVRYSSEGILDPTFGAGGVFQLPGVDPTDSLADMSVLPDDKIVIGGTKNLAMAALRLLADGSALDTDFGSGGIANASGGQGRAMALQPDGRILVAGRDPTGQNTAVVRFDAEGSQEMDFGGAGFAQQSLVPGIDFAEFVAVQDDGKIVAACLTSGGTNDMGVVRFLEDGNVDTSFSEDGFLVEPVASGQDIPYGLAFQADGRIVLAGSAFEGTDGGFGVLRLNPPSAATARTGLRRGWTPRLGPWP